MAAEDQPLDLDAQIEHFWFMVEHGWDIEPRSYFEEHAVKMGFKSPVEMAVHHMWKRQAKDWPTDELRAQLAAPATPTPRGWYCGCGHPNGINLAVCACCGRAPGGPDNPIETIYEPAESHTPSPARQTPPTQGADQIDLYHRVMDAIRLTPWCKDETSRNHGGCLSHVHKLAVEENVMRAAGMPRNCPKCKGKGYIERPMQNSEDCSFCHQTGTAPGTPALTVGFGSSVTEIEVTPSQDLPYTEPWRTHLGWLLAKVMNDANYPEARILWEQWCDFVDTTTTTKPRLKAEPTCEHGTALDVHCCNCHSGFIFDKDHECPAAPTSAGVTPPTSVTCQKCGLSWRGTADHDWADCPGCIAVQAGARIQDLQRRIDGFTATGVAVEDASAETVRDSRAAAIDDSAPRSAEAVATDQGMSQVRRESSGGVTPPQENER